MSAYRTAFVLTLPLAVASAAAMSQPPPNASAAPLRVTTDSPEYCDQLADRIAAERTARPSATPDVQQLADEGHRMCEIGLIRGGLWRLRRALQLLEGQK